MKITYVAATAELTQLSQVLVRRHRGRVALRFTEGGVEAEVEVGALDGSSAPEAREVADDDIVSSEVLRAA